MVTKLDRLARSLPDARDIAGELTSRQVKLNLVHNAGTHTSAELAELFSVARSTVYRAIQTAAARSAT